MLLNICIQEICISTVPLWMEEKYFFFSLDWIKDLKILKTPTKINANQPNPKPQPAIEVSSCWKSYGLASAGGSLSPGSWRKKAVIMGDDPCCPVESCMMNSVRPSVLEGFLPGILYFV